MTQSSLADAADHALPVEAPAHVAHPADIRLGATFDGFRDRGPFAPRTRTIGSHCHDLSDVVIRNMLLFKNGEKIRETGYLAPDDEWASAEHYLDQANAEQVDQDFRVVIGGNRVFKNYYHWLAQALPAIDHALRVASDRPLRLGLWHDRAKWQEDSLTLLGHADRTTLELREHRSYRLPFARYVDFLDGHTAFEVSMAARRTYERLAGGVPDMPTGHEAIYVARTDTGLRKLTNEAELIEMLRRRGISHVVPGNMTLAMQINLFRRARLVIGPQGSGLTNVVFCRPGAVVYELIQQTFPNACNNLLAQSGGLTYCADLFASDTQSGPEHEIAWRIPLDVVERRLDEITRSDQRPVFAGPRPPAPETTPAIAIDAAAADAPSRTGTQPPLRVGIAIVTYNRMDTALRTVRRVRELTGGDYEFVVADDGSSDGTVERLRAEGVPVVTGKNMGVAWNKNRALFHLAVARACDVIVMLEDDTRPDVADWQERWVEGARRWGHVNLAGEWFRDQFTGGAGTPEDPILCKDITGQCSAFTREALMYGGFMDPRFRGYGFEHVEHTWRLARYGFGGTLAVGPGDPSFKLIAGGLELEQVRSHGTTAEIDRNRDLCHSIMWEDHFRAPWSNAEQMEQFRRELAAVSAVSAAGAQDRTPAAAPAVTPRNLPCPCGSGVKFKHCCGRLG